MAARPYITGICQSQNHDRCPHRVRDARTVVKNTAGGTRVIELAALACGCKCHPKETTK